MKRRKNTINSNTHTYQPWKRRLHEYYHGLPESELGGLLAHLVELVIMMRVGIHLEAESARRDDVVCVSRSQILAVHVHEVSWKGIHY